MSNINNTSDFYRDLHFPKQLYMHSSSASSACSTCFCHRIRESDLEGSLRSKRLKSLLCNRVYYKLLKYALQLCFKISQHHEAFFIFWLVLVVTKFYLHCMKIHQKHPRSSFILYWILGHRASPTPNVPFMTAKVPFMGRWLHQGDRWVQC